MAEKGCDNCYYTYFDEKAYPCSLCIRGIERTDQWQSSKKTKAEIKAKTEPITHDDYIETENDHLEARCLNCHNAKACKENHWEGCRYEPWKLTAVEDEPQTDIGTSDTVYSDTAGYVPRVDMTDCSWQKGE